LKETGFSFPCASIAQPESTFERFIEADPQSVLNPYPLLAHRQNLRQAYTQPLVRIYYWPSVDPANGLEEAIKGISIMTIPLPKAVLDISSL
jgi:hypothetical protein